MGEPIDLLRYLATEIASQEESKTQGIHQLIHTKPKLGFSL